MVYDMMHMIGNPQPEPKLMHGNYYLNIFAFSLYFNKDIYLGRSIAKRILKLQLVDVKTNAPANPIKCFIRNITTILWPIEGIVALINNQRRIGDYIAGTKLVPYDPALHKAQPNWILIIVSLVLSMLFLYVTMFLPIEIMFRNSAMSTH